MNHYSTSLLPVGTILAFAGTNPENFAADGWLVCNGAAFERNAQPELFTAIGTRFGSPSETAFNLPNLAGMFLRGATGITNNDPDADERTALMAGGAKKKEVGSFQKYGTAPAKNPFKSESISRFNITSSSDQDGCNDPPADYNSGSDDIKTTSGGDKETRPVNNYVYFVIKASLVTASKKYVTPPIGAVLPFAASRDNAGALQQNWLLCDGKTLSNKGVYGDLFQSIGFAHGQAGETDFVLPDYRGFFLRGVASGSSWDPDRDERTVPYPAGKDGQKGNKGDRVGSIQTSATGLPNKGPLVTSFPHIPKSSASKRQPFYSRDYCVHNTDATTVNLTASGGDNESRPLNVYVDWYIRFA